MSGYILHIYKNIFCTSDDVVPVFGTAVFENCPHEFLTEEYSLNIANAEFEYQSSRSFRNGLLTHILSELVGSGRALPATLASTWTSTKIIGLETTDLL